MSDRTAFPDDEAIEVLIKTVETVDFGLSSLAVDLKNGKAKNAELKVKVLKSIIRCDMKGLLGIKDEDEADA